MAKNHTTPLTDLISRGYRIEFIDGPFDGLVETFPVPPLELPQDLMWLVSANVFEIMRGQRGRLRQPVTSIAIYERQHRRGVWHYVFIGAISPQELGKQFAEGNFCFARMPSGEHLRSAKGFSRDN